MVQIISGQYRVGSYEVDNSDTTSATDGADASSDNSSSVEGSKTLKNGEADQFKMMLSLSSTFSSTRL